MLCLWKDGRITITFNIFIPMWRVCILISLLSFICANVASQSREAEEWIESILANQDEDAELDLNTLLEQINEYSIRPFNLNAVAREELSALFFLSDLEIEALLSHREEHGDFLDILELQSVEGLALDKVRLLASISRVGGLTVPVVNQGLLRDQKHELYLKWRRVLEDQKGYSEENSNPYLGDPNKLYMRYKYTAGKKIQVGLTGEKDAGEEFFTGSNGHGFDYYSGHLRINKPLSFINKVVLGDYSINFGQGLVAAMGFGTGKSIQVMNVKNRNRPLRAYTSVDETIFMRGGAVDFRLAKNLDLIAFGSYRARDANFFLDTVSSSIFTLYTSIPSDGFHRTEREIAREKQLGFSDLGGSLRYRKESLTINANFLRSKFGSAINQETQLHQLFSAIQQTYLNGSIDYSYIWKNINFFGEAASDRDGDLAFVNGLIMGLDKSLEVSVVHRNIARDYQSVYANAFTESSTARNEAGLYGSFIFRFNKAFQMQGYADLFRFPWLRFRVASASVGHEYYFKFLYHKKRKADFYVQYFFEEKEQNASGGDFKTRQVLDTRRHRLRFHNSYQVNANFEIRNRLEFSRFIKGGSISRGFMLYQDLIIKPKDFPLSATLRYALFDTDDFDSRIYAFENDLLYEFSIPSFFNRGFRTYANLRYRINRFLTAEFRLSRTYFNDRETIGSAGEEINGNQRTDVKAQLRFKF